MLVRSCRDRKKAVELEWSLQVNLWEVANLKGATDLVTSALSTRGDTGILRGRVGTCMEQGKQRNKTVNAQNVV